MPTRNKNSGEESGTRNQHTAAVVAHARPIPLESCGRDVISAPQHSLRVQVGKVEEGGPSKQVVIRHCRGGVCHFFFNLNTFASIVMALRHSAERNKFRIAAADSAADAILGAEITLREVSGSAGHSTRHRSE